MRFSNVLEKPIKVPDLDHRRADLFYFNFNSAVSAVVIANRALDRFLFLDFSLCLPQTLPPPPLPPATSFDPLSATTATPSSMASNSQPLSDFDAKLSGFTDVSFDKLGVTELRPVLTDTRTAILLLVAIPPSPGVQPSKSFFNL